MENQEVTLQNFASALFSAQNRLVSFECAESKSNSADPGVDVTAKSVTTRIEGTKNRNITLVDLPGNSSFFVKHPQKTFMFRFIATLTSIGWGCRLWSLHKIIGNMRLKNHQKLKLIILLGAGENRRFYMIPKQPIFKIKKTPISILRRTTNCKSRTNPSIL